MLLVIRHAESIENATKYNGFYQNPRPYDGETAHRISRDEVGLTARGSRQCQWLRGILNPYLESDPAIYCSEYLRARSTAEIATEGVDGLNINVTQALNEQHYGEATYMTKDELFEKYPLEKHTRETKKHLWVPPGGISLVDMIQNQLTPFLEEIMETKCQESKTILFTHLTVIMGLRSLLENRSIEDVIMEHRDAKVPNAGVYYYDVHGKTQPQYINMVQPVI